jgi:hypothetical protein
VASPAPTAIRDTERRQCDVDTGCHIVKNAATQAPQEAPGSLLPDNAPTENLLKTLAGYNGAFESVDAAMQDIVDILREREVSWASIGRALAVSRQAAWKRFG